MVTDVGDPSGFQRRFAGALFDSSQPPPATDSRAERRFGIYRNNVVMGLIDALATRFQVVRRLVGDSFFAAMAREYAVQEPPRSPLLIHYGATFPDFLDRFPPCAALPYLGDVARLEFARGKAYHAPDVSPLDAIILRELPGSFADLQLSLHPSAAVLTSAYPIVSIWAANQLDDVPPVDLSHGESVLVVRPHAEVELMRLPPGGADFIQALLAGSRLSAALKAGARAAPVFDIIVNLAVLIRANAIVGVKKQAQS